MSKFALTAQLQLQAPKNTNQVISQIKRDLKNGATIDIQVKGAAQAQKQIKSVTKETKKATRETNQLGKAIGAAFKRYVAFAAAGRALSFAGKLSGAIDEAIQFERELVKIAQVTGKTTKQLKGLEKTVTSLATNLGVTSAEILGVGRVLSQAGIKANELDVALSALAKTALAPTFSDITKTTEGAIAILSQFGNGVRNLERDLSAINAVAGQFAVESDDLIDGVRRFGGVFKSAGGSIEELLGLITSVRATTRESAESINTGLRTIFTRLQRPKTLQYLEELGVSLKTAEGAFVGPFEAVKRLNKAFANLPAGSTQFIQIAEELGGFRQIGKVIPLLQQFEIAEKARQAAIAGGNSLSDDAAKAQEALAVRITKVKEEFLALVRAFTQDSAFNFLVDQTLQLASNLIKVADAIRPIIPLLAAIAIPKALSFAGGAIGGLTGGISKKNTGGKILGFNSGGFVPGAGNRDTVPAMLTPGEFVIKKSSVNSLGAGTLEAMNNNGYNGGGFVKDYKKVGAIGLKTDPKKPDGIIDADGKAIPGTTASALSKKGKTKSGEDVIGSLASNPNLIGDQSKLGGANGLFQAKKGLQNEVPPELQDKYPSKTFALAAESLVRELGFGGPNSGAKGIKTQGFGRSIPDPEKSETTLEQNIIDTTTGQVQTLIATVGRTLAKAVGIKDVKKKKAPKKIIDQIGIDSIAGKVFEGGVSLIDGKPYDEETSTNLAPFDFPGGIGAAKGTIKSLDALSGISTDAKKTISSTTVKGVATNKVNNAIAQDILSDGKLAELRDAWQKNIKDRNDALKRRKGPTTSRSVPTVKLNTGGSVPNAQDTVPAMLTPGEFVISKPAAQSIGYSNLRSMNSKGVKGFNKGGAVGVQKFAGGGSVLGGGIAFGAASTAFGLLQSKIESLGKVTDDMTIAQKEAAAQSYKWGASLKRGQTALIQFGALFLILKKVNKGITSWTDAVAKSEDVAESKGEEGGGEDKESQETKDNTAAVKENTAALKGEGSKEEKKDDKKSENDAKNTEKQKRAKEKPKKKQSVDERRANLKSTIKKENAAKRETNNAQAKLNRAVYRYNNIIKDSNAALQKTVALQKTKNKYEKDRSNLRVGKGGEKAFKRDMGIFNRAIQQTDDELKKAQAELRGYNDGLKDSRTKGRAARDELEKQTEKTNAIIKVRVKEQKELDTTTRRLSRNAAKIKQNSTLQGRFAYAMSKSNTLLGKGQKALQQFGLEIDKVRRKAKRGLGRGGGLRRGIGAVGKGVGAAFGVAASAGILAQAIGGAISDIANRQKDLAIENGDASRAGAAARTGAIAEEGTRLFTLAGIAELFTLSAGERSQNRRQRVGKRQTDAEVQAATGNANSLLEQRKEDRKGGRAGSLKDLASDAGKEFGDAARTIEDQFSKGNISKKIRDEQLRNLKGSSTEVAKEIGRTAKSINDLESDIKLLSGGNKRLYSANIAAAKSAFALAKAQEATSKAQFESLQLSSTFAAANAAVDSFLNQIQSGADPLNAFIKNVEAGANSIGVDSRGSIDKLEKSLLEQVKGTGLEGAVSNQADTARAANDFSLSVGKRLSGLNLKTDPGEKKAQVEAALFKGLGTDASGQAIRQQISSVLAGADFENLNLSEIIKKVQTNVNGLSAGLLESAKLQAAHNAKMTSLYKQREDLENKAAQSQIKAIDTQLEAAKIFESAGGAKLTSGQKSQARVSQFNQLGSLAGVSLNGGGAADIKRTRQQINDSFFAQQNQDIVSRNAIAGGGTGAFAGPKGTEKDRRPELVAAQAQLIATTKQQISIRQEELKIIQQKNAAEKSALDKLISGDVDGFIKGQEAAGAAAALETGDKGLASLFGAQSLGEGFKALQARGDGTSAAAEATLGAFGISDKSSAGVLAGKTPEQEALNAEIRNLATVLGDIAQDQASFDNSNLQISNATIQITEAQFESALQSSAGNVQGKWTGGTIYASTGAFIPRGTDTVPAMLTPGEFVVNRRAVQSGNNLQVLRAMNSGAGSGASGQGGMNGGGSVGSQVGGAVEAIASAFGGGVNGLMAAFGNFNQAVEKLSNLTLTLNIPDTNIRVSVDALNVAGLREQVVSEVMDKVGREISNSKITNTGEITKATSVLPKIA